ncbi:hypothetical protein K360107B91_20000 [Enterocloster bolteae]
MCRNGVRENDKYALGEKGALGKNKPCKKNSLAGFHVLDVEFNESYFARFTPA